jgi:RsiW-degrading membrane proteinase PrsW (M82 family)
MSTEFFTLAPVGLLPVLILLVVLVYMDSYKLVKLRLVLAVIAAGAAVTVLVYFINGWLQARLGLGFVSYSRYVAPVVEEFFKALVLVYLFRTNRIGFLVDSAIFGFAVGAGFAVAENFFYLYAAADAGVGVWVVRGFGTAVMHGAVMAIFGIISQTLTERNMQDNPLYYLPGLMIATLLHSVFNHFPFHPMLMTLAILVVFPPILFFVFQRSAARMHKWLELDFDADARLLEQINSREFSSSRAGRFLNDLRQAFPGPVVVDMLCYLRLYTELAMRAKGLLLMRENGLDVAVGERTRAKFEELAYLEKSIGRTGVLAMRPFLHMERKDLWQLNVLVD